MTSTLTLDQWLSVVARLNGKCAYCGDPFETIDHVTPMASGGENSAANVLPACAFCNNSKHNTPFAEWEPQWLREAV